MGDLVGSEVPPFLGGDPLKRETGTLRCGLGEGDLLRIQARGPASWRQSTPTSRPPAIAAR